MEKKEIRVIVIEDDPIIRFTLTRMLKNKYSSVDSAENGLDGLHMISSKKYDVIVTDLQMPIMDGYTMIQRVRESDTETPIIICSAYDFEETKEYNCKWLSKPIIISNLFELIESA